MKESTSDLPLQSFPSVHILSSLSPALPLAFIFLRLLLYCIIIQLHSLSSRSCCFGVTVTAVRLCCVISEAGTRQPNLYVCAWECCHLNRKRSLICLTMSERFLMDVSLKCVHVNNAISNMWQNKECLLTVSVSISS